MIRVQHLFKEFDDPKSGIFRALDDVSFEVRPGEIYGLLGPNGAGKTTCLRILSTVLRPTRGLAEVDGINVVRNPEGVRSRIGFMSCNTGIYDRMTAWEMVEYYGRLYGIPEEKLQTRIQEIFEVLQMNDIRDRLGGKLSTGMKQKVSIARTIVHDPPVIIFDEPTSGLDFEMTKEVYILLKKIHAQGKTVLFTSHRPEEIKNLATRIMVLHHGALVFDGTPAQYFESHIHQNLYS